MSWEGMEYARIDHINKKDVLVSRGPFSLYTGRGDKRMKGSGSPFLVEMRITLILYKRGNPKHELGL